MNYGNQSYSCLALIQFSIKKVSETAAAPLEKFGNISKKLLTEIEVQFGNLFNNINLHSSDTVSSQIRLLAIGFENDIENLALLINKIKTLNVQLEDSTLNKVLNETLPYSLQNFIKLINYLRDIQTKDLTTKHF
ncbi:MAG TPA: hypothetical protein VN843_22155 [Anaerolineales bacterium]|nr:hypothetical protein [Anaerolineales bacterium]